MKSFLFLALLASAAVLVVLAVVFRNERARGVLRTLRNAAWIYIALVLALGLWRLWNEGL